jgi:DNA-binding MarR family transcriptional regulator
VVTVVTVKARNYRVGMSTTRRSQRRQQDPDLGVLAARLLFAFQGELFAGLAERGHGQLRPRHGAVIAYLDEGGIRASEVARLSGQHKQVVTRLVDELEELGYVQRRPDPGDRRAKLVVPTKRGREVMRQADQITAGMEHRHAEVLGPTLYAEVRYALQRLLDPRQGGP